MKKTFFTFFAILFFVLGAIFFIVPGPSLIFIMLGLFLLSFYYPKARFYLKRCQSLLQKSCYAIDKALKK
ncbi:PGPGW domain-containing protein [Pseudoalteromonas tunicata]|uniref:PGPGW domain-containing protein n=1 Tax=Pseudoalteromonas tunicata TaxID=314281 RepID=UPI00273FC301|nr:PGPGW domain-containing protein [Pseudoalteromonas tunicata]MDP4982604.1 hypothetical protein [Pseudoalteromonas tunicata]MDP5214444.1 hypothetical protein [Pseudoalteromonas tunicata]